MDFARAPRHVQGVQFSSDVVPRAENTSQPVFPRSRFMHFKTGRFRRADRILCTRDFWRAVRSGKRRSSESFVVVIAPKTKSTVQEFSEKHRRLGVTVSKRVGNSVIRNRVKRCIREWFRHAREGLPKGSDIVVIARRTARDLSSCEIATILDEMIRGTRAQRDGRATVNIQ
jgi:ribonuclease P protein component